MDNAKLSEVLYPVQTYMCQKASPKKIKKKNMPVSITQIF